jgi:hopanoid-associated phosphorylase
MLVVVSGMAFEAKIARGQGIKTVYGMNPQALDTEMEQAVSHGASGILSFGTAAGLSPNLQAGAIVIARNVHRHDRSYAANREWAQRLSAFLPEATVADVAGVDEPITSIEEKSALFQRTGAFAADMESHRVARMAERHHLPFAVLRVVLDSAVCALPPAALASTHSDGRINILGLLGSLIAHPGQIPALITLAGDHAKAKRALVNCGGFRERLFGLHG